MSSTLSAPSLSRKDREKRSVGIWIDPRVDTAVDHLRADTRITKSEIYELGARIVLAIAKTRKIPDDLGEVLAEHDPEALDMLRELVEKIKSVEG